MGRLRYATAALVRGTGVLGDFAVALQPDGTFEHFFTVEFGLQIGVEHQWQIVATNDFSQTDRWTPVVRRRGNVYQSQGLVVEFWHRSDNDDDFLLVTIYYPGGATQEFDVDPSKPIPVPDVTASQAEFLFLYSFRWHGMTHPPNYLREPKDLPSGFSLGGLATDPDWRRMIPYALVPESSVETGDDHQQIYALTPQGKVWARADLRVGAGGAYPVVWY